jgi:broad specificity phosphatase PhoE
MQTARAVADAAGCEVQPSAAIDEVDFGAWSGRPFAELEGVPGWRRWNAERERARTPAGDGIAAVQERALGLVAALAHTAGDASLVLVTHAEVIRSLVLHALGAPAGDYLAIDVPPASVTDMVMAGGVLRLASRREWVPA